MKNEVSAAFDGLAPPPCVTGGATRRQSAKAGLEYIAATGGAGNVLIHDAARPFLLHAVINRLLDALRDNAGAVPVLPVADTLARGTASLRSEERLVGKECVGTWRSRGSQYQ